MQNKTCVRVNGQITLPVSIRKIFHIDAGDIMEIETTKKGILLKPKKLVDASQIYFWTKEWQKKEKEADKDYKKGHYKKFDKVDDLIADLHS